MSLHFTVDIQNDRLLAVPHIGLALLTDLSDLQQKLRYNLWTKNFQALIGFFRELIIILVIDHVYQDGHTTQLNDLTLV